MAQQTHLCPIWGTTTTVYPTRRDGWEVESPRTGGRYFVSSTAAAVLKNWDEHKKLKLTSWLIEQRDLGVECPEITSRSLEEVEFRRPLTLRTRADRLLNFMESQQNYIGQPIPLKITGAAERLYGNGFTEFGGRVLAYSESIRVEEAEFLIRQLESEGFLKEVSQSTDESKYEITLKGYTHLSDLQRRNIASKQAFVAMWFDDSMTDVYDVAIAPAIREVGYEPLRIDRKDHNNKIDDEIIAEIRRSRFLVADFTHGQSGARGGVYYEAGFAHGLNMPVIFTCRSDAIDHVHFDTRQYNHISWMTPKELKEKLTKRIGATIGDGPLRKPI